MIVNPLMKNNRGLGSEAKTDVIFRVEIDGHGIAEFQNTSRSMIYSGFVASLQAFQFYINCDRTFHRLGTCFEDASSRHRGDTAQECLTDLAKLTTVNTYERKR